MEFAYHIPASDMNRQYDSSTDFEGFTTSSEIDVHERE